MGSQGCALLSERVFDYIGQKWIEMRLESCAIEPISMLGLNGRQ